MWDNDEYLYSSRVLRVIAENYVTLYDGLSFRDGDLVSHPMSLAEFKADFDMALSHIGRGCWVGAIGEFKNYRQHGLHQRVIIADILGVPDGELYRMNFHNIPRLKVVAYSRMRRYLNGEED
uniref:Uncharacterized protein n=1 Tax=viral metagenome TaxID=1070528 RepID=A0A6M3JK26_9ZZZZ